MSENKHDEGNTSSQPTVATAPPALPPEIVPATTAPAAAQLPQTAQPPVVTPPATVSPPTFDARLIHIIEKSDNPPAITAVQRPDIVQGQILEQKEK